MFGNGHVQFSGEKEGVGNSDVFVGNLPQQLQTIARTHGVDITYKDISRHANRGGTLREHKENAISEMQSGRFDYVVFQDDQIKKDIDGFIDDIRVLSDEARKNGVIPVLFNSAWASDKEHLNMNTESYKQVAEKTQDLWENRYPCGEYGGWVHYRILTDDELADVIKLLAIRKKSSEK